MELCKETELPEYFWNKKVSRFKGALGPAFMFKIQEVFDEPISVEEALAFHKKKYGSIKGLSLYIPEDDIWLIFVFSKFQDVKKEAAEATVTIGGVELDKED